ncbi:hypothetical protein TNCV_1953241 [Trichonephila clavipes]|nr:hypothetical protein TNCV_1953241 [Trichonephila clavipes]
MAFGTRKERMACLTVPTEARCHRITVHKIEVKVRSTLWTPMGAHTPILGRHLPPPLITLAKQKDTIEHKGQADEFFSFEFSRCCLDKEFSQTAVAMH